MQDKTTQDQPLKKPPVVVFKPVTLLLNICLVAGAVLFLPVPLIFWMAIILPVLQIIKYIDGYRKLQNGYKEKEKAKLKVFVGLGLVLSVLQTILIGILLALFAHDVLSTKYLMLIAIAYFVYSNGFMFNKFAQKTNILKLNSHTRLIYFLKGLLTIVNAVFVQYAVTQYLTGGNTPISILLLCIGSVPTSLYLLGSVYRKELDYHPSDRW